MALDPLRKFSRWWRDAEKHGCPLSEAMALATADADGRPSVRYVLLKGTDPRGFLFYTNELSRKGEELRNRPAAALAFYWHDLGRQVRVEGEVEMVSDEEADAYWRTRPRGSQIASSVSRQSARITSRTELMARFRETERRSEGEPIPRPSHWKGYVLRPKRIEFWTRREPRLHDRELFVRNRRGWSSSRLQP